jgi:hypothetical protein
MILEVEIVEMKEAVRSSFPVSASLIMTLPSWFDVSKPLPSRELRCLIMFDWKDSKLEAMRTIVRGVATRRKEENQPCLELLCKTVIPHSDDRLHLTCEYLV